MINVSKSDISCELYITRTIHQKLRNASPIKIYKHAMAIYTSMEAQFYHMAQTECLKNTVLICFLYLYKQKTANII